jgi:anti-sigma B factor antagonist
MKHLTVTSEDLPPDRCVVTAVGELDYDSQPLLRQAAMEALGQGRVQLVVDLTGVSFCDSSGLALFVDLHQATEARGGWLRLAGVQPAVLSILRLTNLDRLLTVQDDARDAGV